MPRSVTSLGDQVTELIAGATSSVVIVAPFIKRAPLERLLEAVAPEIALSCYTRWRPDEIAAGVSDLEVWPLLRARNGTLRLRYDLHAKVFQADGLCLVGSANVTLAALGWAPAANLELLVPVSADDEVLAAFFDELDRKTVEVTDAIHAEMLEVVNAFPGTPAVHDVAAEEEPSSLAGWL